jgi:hypothetical protein
MRVIGASILGIIFGLLLTIGGYIYLVESGSYDPASKTGLIFPIGGAVLGLLVGVFGGRRRKELL